MMGHKFSFEFPSDQIKNDMLSFIYSFKKNKLICYYLLGARAPSIVYSSKDRYSIRCPYIKVQHIIQEKHVFS